MKQKYFNDPTTGLDWHCDDIFNWVAIDKDSSLFVYQSEPIKRINVDGSCNYWTGGARSQDLCVVQRSYYYPDWEISLRRLTG